MTSDPRLFPNKPSGVMVEYAGRPPDSTSRTGRAGGHWAQGLWGHDRKCVVPAPGPRVRGRRSCRCGRHPCAAGKTLIECNSERMGPGRFLFRWWDSARAADKSRLSSRGKRQRMQRWANGRQRHSSAPACRVFVPSLALRITRRMRSPIQAPPHSHHRAVHKRARGAVRCGLRRIISASA